ncbi:MAG: hypothetical protein JZU50_10940 [Desulfobulbaceae bacterium]|nr:hypothetical protein [Desulfobulbaceae bacterium]
MNIRVAVEAEEFRRSIKTVEGLDEKVAFNPIDLVTRISLDGRIHNDGVIRICNIAILKGGDLVFLNVDILAGQANTDFCRIETGKVGANGELHLNDGALRVPHRP